MIELIKTSARKAFENNQESWLLSAMTDWSYEEGDAPGFASFVSLFSTSGVAQHTASRMRLGINGYLNEELQNSGITILERNKRNGPDFIVRFPECGTRGTIEVKLCFDCTLSKYYRQIAQDREKLLSVAAGHLFQVIYLVSLPQYDYPNGVWNGKKAKRREVNNCGVRAQWRAIRTLISEPTAWEDGELLTIPFSEEAKQKCETCLASFYSKVFIPSSSWHFDRRIHLANASVSIALWQWR